MITAARQARPFLKWAGGKRQLLPQFQAYFPLELNGKGLIKHYYEPFLGSGAVFFWVKQNCKLKEAFINEFNPEIYFCYKAIQHNVEKLIKSLKILEQKYYISDDVAQEELYYQIRHKYNATRKGVNFRKFHIEQYIERAVLTIFLNRTCFNGLYRVNLNGDFNVPFGRYNNPVICDADNLRAVNQLLKGVVITNNDFSVIEQQIKNDSFVYFDPPYRPLNKTSNFTAYSKNTFDDKEQNRLASVFKKLSKIEGVKIMLSNSDPKNEDKKDNFFDDLYSGFRIKRLKARRMINCDALRRGEINEILVMNY